MAGREIDILSVLDDAIDQATEGLPDYLTSVELLTFSGLDEQVTKRELGLLMSGAGIRAKPKRIDENRPAKFYADSDILAAIRERRGSSTSTGEATSDSGDDMARPEAWERGTAMLSEIPHPRKEIFV